MTPLKEFEIASRNIFTNSLIILGRHDKEQTKRLKELWVGFGIDLDEINKETMEILNDKME